MRSMPWLELEPARFMCVAKFSEFSLRSSLIRGVGGASTLDQKLPVGERTFGSPGLEGRFPSSGVVVMVKSDFILLKVFVVGNDWELLM